MTTPSRSTILHIGTHRTGTTSIQSFLREEVGAPTFPEGFYPGYGNCHAEWLVASSLLYERADRAPTREKLQREAASEVPLLLYSCEQLSTFRDPKRLTEIRRLCLDRRLHVVMYTREPKAFLKSYKLARAMLGKKPSTDPDSEDYYEPDSWLVDYPSRIALWRAVAEDVTVVDYDEVTKRDGSVLPSFAKLVGMSVRNEYRLNTSAELSASLAAAIRALGKE